MFGKHAQPRQIKAQPETPPTFFQAKLEQLENRTLLSLDVAGRSELDLVRHFEPQLDAPPPAVVANQFHRVAERSMLAAGEPTASQTIVANDLWIGRTAELLNKESPRSDSFSTVWNRIESSMPESRDNFSIVPEFTPSNANGQMTIDHEIVEQEEVAQSVSKWNRGDDSINRWKGDSFDPRPNNVIGSPHGFVLGDRLRDLVDHGIDPINEPPSQIPAPPRVTDPLTIVVLPTTTSKNATVPSTPRQIFDYTPKSHFAGRHETAPLAQNQTWRDADVAKQHEAEHRQPAELWDSDVIANSVNGIAETVEATTTCSINRESESPASAAEYVEAACDIAAAGAFAVMLAPPLSRLLTACPIMTPDGPLSPWQLLWAWVRRRKAKRSGAKEAPNEESPDEVASYEPIEAAILNMISSAADRSIKILQENPAMVMASGICASGAAVASVWGIGESRRDTNGRRRPRQEHAAPVNEGTTHLAISLT